MNEETVRTSNPATWAKSFCELWTMARRHDDIEFTGDELEGVMIGWFANAMEAAERPPSCPHLYVAMGAIIQTPGWASMTPEHIALIAAEATNGDVSPDAVFRAYHEALRGQGMFTGPELGAIDKHISGEAQELDDEILAGKCASVEAVLDAAGRELGIDKDEMKTIVASMLVLDEHKS